MIRVLSATPHFVPMRLRLPFRYGIVTLREIEHCFVRVRVLIDGVACEGIAADGLAPKWFTKNPASTIAHDVAELKDAIAATCTLAVESGTVLSVFAFWRRLYDAARARFAAMPALLRSFGPSLIERAVIDAFCRVKGQIFARAVRDNTLGIALGDIHLELAVFKDLKPGFALGLGVIDIKDNEVESADTIAKRIELAARTIGAERVKWVHPDCGFWMLPRSVADRKIRALVQGRDLYEGAR